MQVQTALTFATIAFDSKFLRAGSVLQPGFPLKFFGGEDDGATGSDVTKQGEGEIIRWILGSPAKRLLFGELGVELNAFTACSVRQPVVANPQDKPGDIDLLICPEHRADRAIAF